MPATAQTRLTLLDWSSADLHLVWAYDHAVAPVNRHLAATRTANTDIGAWRIRAGSVAVTEKDRVVHAHAGQWVFATRRPHRHDFSDDARILSVNFHASWPNGESLFDLPTTLVLQAADAPELERKAMRLVRWLAARRPGRMSASWEIAGTLTDFLGIQGALLDWINTFAGAMARLGAPSTRIDRTDPRLLKAAMALERHSPAERLDQAAIAGQAGISQSHLERLFTARYGTTPRRYMERRRVRIALQRIEHSEDSIKEIAFRLGFKTLAHFSAWFRRSTGVSPRQARSRPRRR